VTDGRALLREGHRDSQNMVTINSILQSQTSHDQPFNAADPSEFSEADKKAFPPPRNRGASI